MLPGSLTLRLHSTPLFVPCFISRACQLLSAWLEQWQGSVNKVVSESMGSVVVQMRTLICKLGWASKGLWGIPGTFQEKHLEHYQVCWCCSRRQYATLCSSQRCYPHAGNTLCSFCRWYAMLMQVIHYTHTGDTLCSHRQYTTLMQAIHYADAGDKLCWCRQYATLMQVIHYADTGDTLHSLYFRWKSGGMGAQPPASWSQVLKVGLQTLFTNCAIGTDWSLYSNKIPLDQIFTVKLIQPHNACLLTD